MKREIACLYSFIITHVSSVTRTKILQVLGAKIQSFSHHLFLKFNNFPHCVFYIYFSSTLPTLKKGHFFDGYTQRQEIEAKTNIEAESLECANVCSTLDPIIILQAPSAQQFLSFSFCDFETPHNKGENSPISARWIGNPEFDHDIVRQYIIQFHTHTVSKHIFLFKNHFGQKTDLNFWCQNFKILDP